MAAGDSRHGVHGVPLWHQKAEVSNITWTHQSVSAVEQGLQQPLYTQSAKIVFAAVSVAAVALRFVPASLDMLSLHGSPPSA